MPRCSPFRTSYSVLQQELKDLFEDFIFGLIDLRLYLRKYDGIVHRSGWTQDALLSAIDDGWVRPPDTTWCNFSGVNVQPTWYN